jgi:hypothetical protein
MITSRAVMEETRNTWNIPMHYLKGKISTRKTLNIRKVEIRANLYVFENMNRIHRMTAFWDTAPSSLVEADQ